MTKRALILGISGQDGAYLAHLLHRKGYVVHGSSRHASPASYVNLERLGLRDRVLIHSVDLGEPASLRALLSNTTPDEIYHLAGQSSVGISFAQPAETFASIAGSTQLLLEELRLAKNGARVFNVASSECYGQCDVPADERTAFRPRSPYAAARAAAFYTASVYRESYGMFVATGLVANHESPLRGQQFVTRKIVCTAARAAEGENTPLNLGNIEVRRDWGWAPEFVEAFWRILQADKPQDYNIATGETNALSDFVAEIYAAAGLDWTKYVKTDNSLARPSEFEATRIDASKIKRELSWSARYKMRDVARLLIRRERDGGLGPFTWESEL
jgi:GDPmannose 4,6-dehydratase